MNTFGARGELNSQNRGSAKPDLAGKLGSPDISKMQGNHYVYSNLGSFLGFIFPKVCVGRFQDSGLSSGPEPFPDTRIDWKPYKTNIKPPLPAKRVASNASKPYKTWGNDRFCSKRWPRISYFRLRPAAFPPKVSPQMAQNLIKPEENDWFWLKGGSGSILFRLSISVSFKRKKWFLW